MLYNRKDAFSRKEKKMKKESELMSILKNLRQHLMGGVSYMIPVVVTGGILYAIATMLSMNSVQQGGAVEASNIVIDVLSQVGGVGLGMMVPVLAAFIAMSIADRPGIAPGLICGQLAVNVGAGFIGGVVAGLLCGIIAQYCKKIPLPKSMQSLKSIMIVPICTSLIVGTVIICVIGTPCAWLLTTLTDWLTSMSGASAILVGALTAAMIGFDLGGPINKVAFSTGVAVVGTTVLAGQNCQFMGPISMAISLPPIALGLETFVLKKKFTQEEKDAGIGAIAMGVCGITEGAISYTTATPILIPINVISCAVGGAVAGALQVYSNAGWGGLVVLPVTSGLTYVISMAVGIAVHMILVKFLRGDVKEEDNNSKDAGDVDVEFEF